MDEKLKILLNKWQQEQLTNEEAKELLQYSRDSKWQAVMENWLQEQYDNAGNGAYFSKSQKRELFKNAVQIEAAPAHHPKSSPDTLMQLPGRTNAKRSKNSVIIGSIVTACIIGCCLYLFYRPQHQPPANLSKATQVMHDIAAPTATTPTISWGQNTGAVNLDQALKDQANRVKRDKNGMLVFSSASPSLPPSTIAVPRGSRPVHIKLPDGSQVWINTGSSLRFPGAFSAGKRTVYLTGEAYFEVVHKNNQVFEVSQGANTVTVLGTQFNVNAYADNPSAKITLIKGLVQINHKTYLHPSQQASLDNGQIQVKTGADLQQVLAWKNNEFLFNGTPAQEILRQLARWYNIELIYKGQKPVGQYSGIISRDNSLTQVLTILEAGGMKFKLEQQSLWIY